MIVDIDDCRHLDIDDCRHLDIDDCRHLDIDDCRHLDIDDCRHLLCLGSYPPRSNKDWCQEHLEGWHSGRINESVRSLG